MKIATAFAAVLALAGCASLDRATMSDFEMTSDSAWRMKVPTGIDYPPESERAEAVRQKWIADHTRANGCNSFEVTSRQWTKAAASLSDKAGTLVYTGTCTR